VLPEELLAQFSDGTYDYESDEGWTMGEGGY
jgi:hypothetical protein